MRLYLLFLPYLADIDEIADYPRGSNDPQHGIVVVHPMPRPHADVPGIHQDSQNRGEGKVSHSEVGVEPNIDCKDRIIP